MVVSPEGLQAEFNYLGLRRTMVYSERHVLYLPLEYVLL